MRLIVAITGASGSLYAQRLLDALDPAEHEVHVVLSRYAPAVITEELGGDLRIKPGVTRHNLRSMNAPFASGSNPADVMVVIPCTMGTLAAIAQGLDQRRSGLEGLGEQKPAPSAVQHGVAHRLLSGLHQGLQSFMAQAFQPVRLGARDTKIRRHVAASTFQGPRPATAPNPAAG